MVMGPCAAAVLNWFLLDGLTVLLLLGYVCHKVNLHGRKMTCVGFLLRCGVLLPCQSLFKRGSSFSMCLVSQSIPSRLLI